MLITLALLSCFFLSDAFGKVFERCELARELRAVHKFEEKEIATWVCIARHESEFNTSAVGHMNWDGSGDHGLFQISDLYWCSPPGKGYSCGVTCAQLEDDDIKDDVVCARRIHRQHQRISGDGFSAWAVYRAHCSSNVDQYVEGCFDKEITKVESLDQSNELPKIEIVSEEKLPQKAVTTEAKVTSEVSKNKPEEKPAFAFKSREPEVVKQGRIRAFDDQLKSKAKAAKPYYAKLYEFVYQP